MSAAALPAAAAPAVLRDFSDRLSPMLVKELRQGLKSPFFVWGLVLMQAAMGLSAMFMIGERDRDASLFFWWAATGVMCILLPLRSANALRDEMSGNTLDTLVLTRLSAWRITLGKWIATASLQVLMAITVLPYLIVRYFSGGVNLPVEMSFLAVFVFFGVMATAIMLGLSFFRYFLLRAAVMLGVLGGGLMFCTGGIFVVVRGSDFLLDELQRELGWSGAGAMFLLALWVIYFFLDLGASQLAPRAENRATRRRLVALGVFGAAAACLVQMDDISNAMGWSAVLSCAALLVCIQAVCEVPANFPPVLQPFVKRGAAGRAAGRLLYPGWHTGVLFSILLLGASAAFLMWMLERYEEWNVVRYAGYGYVRGEDSRLMAMLAFFAGALGAVLVPLVLGRLLARRSPWHFWRWLLFLLVPGALHFLLVLTNEKAASRTLMWAHTVFPTAGFLAHEEGRSQAWRERNERQEQMLASSSSGRPAWSLNQEDDLKLDAWFEDARRSYPRRLEIAACISLSLWTAAALVMALRELRRTTAAEKAFADELRRTAAADTTA